MNIRDYLHPDEIRYFTARSNWRAGQMVLANWLSIWLVFYIASIWTNPLGILLAVVLLSGRQLGLAVIMHDCGHNTFFTSPVVNRLVGQWLAARPIFSDLTLFARSHLEHHRAAGTADDPDLANYEKYPVSRASFRRKLLRDISGQTGFKLMSYNFLSALGIFKAEKRDAARPYVGMILAQLILYILLALTLGGWLYLLWFGSLLTSYMLVIRVRQVAEHGAVPKLMDKDPRQHARTIVPGWLERALFAPNYVNYHLEHHFMASIPCYRLPELHRLLKARGAYSGTRIFDSYLEVVRHAVTDTASGHQTHN